MRIPERLALRSHNKGARCVRSTSRSSSRTSWRLIDFKYLGPQYPGGEVSHTLTIAGYLAAENLYVRCNPAFATPGLQLITAADLKDFWRSDHYGELSKNVLSRPVIVADTAQP